MTKPTEPAREPDWPGPDERLWQNWLAQGHLRDRASALRHVAAVRWCLAVILIAVALFWGFVPNPDYDLVVRFIVALGAVCLMVYEFRRGRLALAVLAGLLAWLYNPVTPSFSFIGLWNRGLLVVSSMVFLLPLMLKSKGSAHHA